MNTQFDSNLPQSQTNHQYPASSLKERPMSATEARQGRTGLPILKVLIAGMILALVAWSLAEIWGQLTKPLPEQIATPTSGNITPVN